MTDDWKNCYIFVSWGQDVYKRHPVKGKMETRKTTLEYLAKGYSVAWTTALITRMPNG